MRFSVFKTKIKKISRGVFRRLHTLSYKQLLIIAVVLGIAVVAIIKLSSPPQKVKADWLNDQWLYRQTYTITNGSTSPQTNFVLQMNLNTSALITAGKMQPSCGDIRFTDSSNEILSYFISNCNSTTSKVFIKVNSIPLSGANINLYYGNPSASNASDGSATFSFASESITTASNSYLNLTNTISVTQVNSENGIIQHSKIPMIKYSGLNDGTAGNHYAYYGSSTATNFYLQNYVIKSGDYITWLEATNTGTTMGCGLEIDFTDASYLRGLVTDQDGQNPAIQNVNDYGHWYWRRVSLANYVGKTISKVDLVSEGDSASAAWNCYYNAIKVVPYTTSITIATSGSETKSPGAIAYYKFDEGYGSTVHNYMESNGQNGLVSWWKFDEGAGTVAYDEMDNLNATLATGSSAPTWNTTGKIANSLTFNGTTTYASVPASSKLDLQKLTIEAWLNFSSFQNGFIFEKTTNGSVNTQYSCFINSTGLYFRTFNTASTQNDLFVPSAQTGINLGAWNHVACVYDGNTKGIYVNGVLVGSSAYSQTLITNPAGTSIIGALGSGSGYFYNGRMDDLRIYNRALTSGEIADNYRSLHGTIIGLPVGVGASWLDGAQGNPNQKILGDSLKFNGTNNTVQIGDSSTLSYERTQAFSIGAWVKTLAASNQYIFGKADSAGNLPGFGVTLDANGRVNFYAANNIVSNLITVVSTKSVSDGKWHHFTITYDGSSNASGVSIYIDGAKDTTTTVSNSLTGSILNTRPPYIGSLNNALYFFSGQIDEFKIYPYAITQSQVNLDYNRSDSVALGVGTKTGYPGSTNLLAWWKFDDNGSNTILDSSGNNNSGISANSTNFLTGKYGKAMNFNGSNVDVVLPEAPFHSIERTSSFSLTSFIKTGTTTPQVIFSKLNSGGVYNGFEFILINGKLNFYAINNNISSYIQVFGSRVITDNAWHQVTMTYNGSGTAAGVKFYIDGVSDYATTAADSLGANSIITSVVPRIGSRNNAYYFFNGLIDNLKFYTKVLSPAEISYETSQNGPLAYYSFDESNGTSLHNSIENTTDSGLVSWWKMDENSGTTSYDNTGNYNLSFGAGASAPTWTTGKVGYGVNFGVGPSGQYLSASATAPNLKQQFSKITIEAWVYPTANLANATIISNTDSEGYALRILNGTLFTDMRLSGSGGAATFTSTTIPLNTWSHVAVVYNGSTIQGYLNGINIGSSAASGYIKNTANSATCTFIGNEPGGCIVQAGYGFAGTIDSVKVQSVALSSDQIYADYNISQGSMIGFGNVGIGATWSEGAHQNSNQKPLGKSLSFNGTSQFVDLGLDNLIRPTNAVSVEAWVNKSSSSGYKLIVGNSNVQGYQLGLNNNIAYFALNTSTSGWIGTVGIAAAAITDGVWAHLVGTYDGTTVKLFINGQEIPSVRGTGTGSIVYSSSNTYIGQLGGSAFYFAGLIDEVKIFGYALSDSDVKTEYNRGVSVALGVGQNPNNAAQQIGTTSSLIGWWKLDEGVSPSTVADSSGYNNSGTFGPGSSAPAQIQGFSGKALDFNGSTDYAEVPNSTSLQLSNKFSFSSWVKLNSVSATYKRIVSKSDATSYDIWFQVNTTNGIDCGVVKSDTTTYAVATTASNIIPLGKWTHVTCTFDSSVGYNIYINGASVPVSPGGTAGPARVTTRNFEIGRLGSAGTWYYGLISLDNIKAYNRVLTPAEVAYDFNQGKPVAEWKFDEKEGTLAHEDTKNWPITNIVPNPSFEVGTSGWSVATTGNGTISQSSVNQYYGKSSLRLYATTGNESDNRIIYPWAASTTYYISGWFYIVGTGGSAPTIFAYDGTNLAYVPLDTTKLNQWQRVTLTYTSSASPSVPSSYLDIPRFKATAISGTLDIYVDGVQIQTASSVANYCDGSLTGDRNYWNGTVNSSTSSCYNLLDVQPYNYSTSNNSQWVTGVNGNALTFNGSNQYLAAPQAPSINFSESTPFSVSAWVKRNSTGSTQEIINKQENVTNEFVFSLELTSTDKANFTMSKQGVAGVGASSTTTIGTGTWYYLTGTYDGTYLYIYVNGKLESFGTKNFSSSTQSIANLRFGSLYNNTNYFNGVIDDVKIFSYGLSASQVLQEYQTNGSAVKFAQ